MALYMDLPDGYSSFPSADPVDSRYLMRESGNGDLSDESLSRVWLRALGFQPCTEPKNGLMMSSFLTRPVLLIPQSRKEVIVSSNLNGHLRMSPMICRRPVISVLFSPRHMSQPVHSSFS